MIIAVYTLFGVYAFCLLLILVFSLTQLRLLWHCKQWLRKNKDNREKWIFKEDSKYPIVTIQLPVYNELYVIERLIHCITKLDYPKDKLEIQVLDDSTDKQCQELANKWVEYYQEKGFDIHWIHRKDRSDFKAGALREGLEIAKGEFIAIFDSDFLPKPDWLKQTVGFFANERVGVVQTRWGHLNRDYSLITKVQAFALDLHFTMEQTGRSVAGNCLNFNGTAGIWRKSCILDAGNWKGDTLTEDIDLSYRAQLKNWKIEYLEDVETPAELPMAISAARSQQHRWNKGGAENLRKMWWTIFRSKEFSFSKKFHALMHLSGSLLYINLMLIALVSVPLLFLKNIYPQVNFLFYLSGVFAFSTLFFILSYWYSYKRIHGSDFRSFPKFLLLFFQFFSLAMGLSLHNAWAVFQGLIGIKSAFVRTPKFNLENKNNDWFENKYLNRGINVQLVLEFLLLLYFIVAVVMAFYLGDFSLFFMHLMFVVGFSYVIILSVSQSVKYA